MHRILRWYSYINIIGSIIPIHLGRVTPILPPCFSSTESCRSTDLMTLTVQLPGLWLVLCGAGGPRAVVDTGHWQTTAVCDGRVARACAPLSSQPRWSPPAGPPQTGECRSGISTQRPTDARCHSNQRSIAVFTVSPNVGSGVWKGVPRFWPLSWMLVFFWYILLENTCAKFWLTAAAAGSACVAN